MTFSTRRTSLRLGGLVAVAALLSMSGFSLAGSTTQAGPAVSRVPSKLTSAHPRVPVHVATAAAKARAAALATMVGGPSVSTRGKDRGEDIANSHYCDGCTVPLLYQDQAPVVNTTGTTGLTITPIYWNPSGKVASPAKYQSIITGYVKNVAAASGSKTNIYSVMPEYYSTDVNGKKTLLRYKITTGAAIVDTQAYPALAASCQITATKFKHCVTDAQLRTELKRLTKAKALKTDLAHFYPVFLAPDTETYDLDGSNSESSFCGYHRSFGTGTTFVNYGNEPYGDNPGCDSGESPNGFSPADDAINTMSHEISEAMTDPVGDFRAWNAESGHEIGDVCGDDYGPPIGFNGDGDTAYNQLINGGKYYTQTEFSNAAYDTLGVGNGCVQGENQVTGQAQARSMNAQVQSASAQALPVVASVQNDAFPNTLPADGTATSDLDIIVSDPDGFAIEGDKVTYTAYAIDGDGQCGTLSAHTAHTGSDGHAHVTYTASHDDVLCAVVATEVDGGQSATGVLYQGLFQAQAIQATAAYPSSVTVGAPATAFQTSFKNPSGDNKISNILHVQLTPGDGATENLDASQVDLSYSTTGPHGTFQPAVLRGSTLGQGAIQTDVLPPAGVTIGAGKTLTVDFKLALKPGVSTANGGAGFDIEGYLDQVNPGSGAISTIGDTLAYPVTVTPGTASPAPSIDGVSTGLGVGTVTATETSGSAGDLIVAFVSGDGTSSQTATVTGGGLSWTLAKRTTTQGGTSEIWTARATGKLSSAAIKAKLSSSTYGEFLTVVAFKNATGIGAVGGTSGATGLATASVTTTGTNGYVFGVGNDPAAAIARTTGANQRYVSQATSSGASYWVQQRLNPVANAGTTVTINESTPTSEKWNLAVIEID